LNNLNEHKDFASVEIFDSIMRILMSVGKVVTKYLEVGTLPILAGRDWCKNIN